MKKIRPIVFFCLLSIVFWSCKKDQTEVTYASGTAPVLTSDVANNDTIIFNTTDTSVQALSFSWTDPNYVFSDGISSLNVNYNIQIDTAGANFQSSLLQNTTIATSLGQTFSVGQLNNIVSNNMNLSVDTPHTIQIRVESYLGVNQVPLYSNVLNYTVTPFPVTKVPLPTSGQLFLVGSATAGGWSNPVPVPSQQFTQVSLTEYSITVTLPGGVPSDATSDDELLFLPVNGSWNTKYAAPNPSETGGSFAYYSSGGSNFFGPTAAGTYVIDVNFKTGLYTMTKQ